MINERERLEELIKQNASFAMFILGRMYENGQVVPQDFIKAKELYEEAVDLGSDNAMVNLANMYLFGRVGPQDLVKAKKLYERAVDLGNDGAMVNLADMYQLGRVVPEDLVKAKELYERAVDLGNASAMSNLARMYWLGQGVPQDLVKAKELCERAIDLGNDNAMVNLAIMYETGEGVPKDFIKARELYEKAYTYVKTCKSWISSKELKQRLYKTNVDMINAKIDEEKKMTEEKNMTEEKSRGYFFLNRSITTAQYYMISEYTQLAYIDAYTIGMNDEMSRYDNCLELCETIWEPDWREAKKTIANEYDRVKFVLQQENVITAMESNWMIRGLSLMLPQSLEQISTEQWKHFLKWYDAETLKNYVTVTFASIPEELKKEIPLQFDTMNDEQKTEVYKSLLDKITKAKGLSLPESQKPMSY